MFKFFLKIASNELATFLQLLVNGYKDLIFINALRGRDSSENPAMGRCERWRGVVTDGPVVPASAVPAAQ